MAITPHIGLTLVEQSQAQKEITVNQAFLRIDALLNTGAVSLSVSVPPVSPAVGDLYIVAASPVGAWAGKAGQIAYFDAVWRFVVPRAGMTLWVADLALLYTYDGAAWVASGGGTFTGAAALTPVFLSDKIPVVRGGSVYLATVADCLAAISGAGSSGSLHFSIAGNSGLLGVL